MTTAAQAPSAAEALLPLRAQGWAMWKRPADVARVDVLREAVGELLDAHAPEALWAAQTMPLGEHAIITPTGFAIPSLLKHRPDLRPLVLPSALLDAVTSLLGAGARLELLGMVATDRSRPFFPWHTHIDGTDESERVQANRWPRIDRLRRIFTLLYLDDIDDDGGPLLVLPRRVGDPCEPPFDVAKPEWQGQVELLPRAGTLVAIDECTWHAARSMRRDGKRVFIGAYFAAAETDPAPWADPTLATWDLTALAAAPTEST